MQQRSPSEPNLSFQNRLAIFVNIGSILSFIGSIEMYRKFGRPKSNLIGHWLKLA